MLEVLGAQYQPSKRDQNYLGYYWMHLRDIRLQVARVLEIGADTGRSLLMWEEFFPNAVIYGIDIDPECQRWQGDRRRVLIGDQGDPDFLRTVTQQADAPFDVIIDDGSHRPDHQLTAFEVLFPRMSTHGVYVIEDTGMGDGLRTVNALKTIIDDVMYWPDGFDPQQWPHLSRFSDDAGWSAKNVVGIAFYRWIVFIMRGRNPEDNPYLLPLQAR